MTAAYLCKEVVPVDPPSFFEGKFELVCFLSSFALSSAPLMLPPSASASSRIPLGRDSSAVRTRRGPQRRKVMFLIVKLRAYMVNEVIPDGLRAQRAFP